MSEAGSERGGRRGFEQSDNKVRDFGNWERKGPANPSLGNAGPARAFDRPGSRDGPLPRTNSAAWGEGRSSDGGSRPPRREFVERPHVDRAPTAAEQDTQWRARMKPDPPSNTPTPNARSPAQSNREASNPPSPAAQPAVPATRPKLNLAKRTVSEAQPDAGAAAGNADSKASPFGGAKPIDTATREKEIEEKRQVALQEKKEVEEKAKEEKRIADEKAKEERKLARDAELAARAAKGDQTPKSPSQSNGEPKQILKREKTDNKAKAEKENGATATPPAKGKYELLRKHTGDEGTVAEDEPEEGEGAEFGNIIGDKETKPQEIVRDPQQDSLTNGNSNTPTEPTAEALEEEGWSTVQKPPRKGRNSNQAARAIAS